MGTKKIGTRVLELLLEGPKTLEEIENALGKRHTKEEVEKRLLKLGLLGYVKIENVEPKRYIVTLLGQAVIENPEK